MMDLKNRMAEEFEKRKDGLLVFALLLGLGFFVNRGVTIKGLYMDDLYLWSCYGEQSFLPPKAQEERAAGTQVLVARMNKNKKFQKEQLGKEGYQEFKEFYKESLKH